MSGEASDLPTGGGIQSGAPRARATADTVPPPPVPRILDVPRTAIERDPPCEECGGCFQSVVHGCCFDIEEIRNIAGDERYSDEFVGNCVRSALRTDRGH